MSNKPKVPCECTAPALDSLSRPRLSRLLGLQFPRLPCRKLREGRAPVRDHPAGQRAGPGSGSRIWTAPCRCWQMPAVPGPRPGAHFPPAPAGSGRNVPPVGGSQSTPRYWAPRGMPELVVRGHPRQPARRRARTPTPRRPRAPRIAPSQRFKGVLSASRQHSGRRRHRPPKGQGAEAACCMSWNSPTL